MMMMMIAAAAAAAARDFARKLCVGRVSAKYYYYYDIDKKKRLGRECDALRAEIVCEKEKHCPTQSVRRRRREQARARAIQCDAASVGRSVIESDASELRNAIVPAGSVDKAVSNERRLDI